MTQELTDEDRRKRVEDCLENLKWFREGKWRLCVEVTRDESCFFIDNLVASRIMLHGLVRVKPGVRRSHFKAKIMVCF